jgi:hypothetical protein
MPSSSSSTTTTTRLVATTALSTLAIAIPTYYLLRLVKLHGWHGTWNLVWQGDPHIHARTQLDDLDQLEHDVQVESSVVSHTETAWERAQLDSIDAASERSVVQLWEHYVSMVDLRTHLALLSDRLDTCAARVDQVPSNNVAWGATTYQLVRQRKRTLSRSIVALMERVDYLMAVYNHAHESLE